eukprot:1149040-Pelagomonas_calceolata.AAC.1
MHILLSMHINLLPLLVTRLAIGLQGVGLQFKNLADRLLVTRETGEAAIEHPREYVRLRPSALGEGT